jgi:hypothetical protein
MYLLILVYGMWYLARYALKLCYGFLHDNSKVRHSVYFRVS